MKLLRYGAAGRERPGMLDSSGAVRDLGGVVNDIDGAALPPSGSAALPL
jgi:2,4-didehydro-3-deoxy-L-rhamnonate hydrolase